MTYIYEDYYETIKDLGEGSMGTVKLAKHKKTGEEFAVKYMKKAKKNETEILYQKREIEALKLC
jgi:serine/threonine protein kinase